MKRARLTDEGKEFLRSIDDIFCKPTPESHVEKELTLYCHICKQDTVFYYHGTQFHEGHRAFDLYNCSQCHGTISHNPSEYWINFLKERYKNVKRRRKDLK